MNENETRKMWRLKGGSYIISLPKEWAERLKEKEVSVLIETDGSLKIIPKKFTLKKEITLNLDEIKDVTSANYYVLTYYMQGFDRIKVVSENPIEPNAKKKLRDLRAEMMGSDIIEEKSNYLVYEILLDITQQKINETISRINDFINGIHKDTVEALMTMNKKMSEEIIERAKDGIKKYRYMIRQIAIAAQDPLTARKIGIENARQCIVYGTVAAYLNRMLHHTASCNGYIMKLERVDEVANDIVLKMSEIAYKMRNEAISSFIKKDLEEAMKVLRIMSIQRDLEEELLNYLYTGKVSVNTAIVYSMMGREFRRISGFSVGVSDALANLILAPIS